jgi:hypothetical protein
MYFLTSLVMYSLLCAYWGRVEAAPLSKYLRKSRQFLKPLSWGYVCFQRFNNSSYGRRYERSLPRAWGMPEHLARRVTDRGTWGYEELIELSRGCHKLAIP